MKSILKSLSLIPLVQLTTVLYPLSAESELEKVMKKKGLYSSKISLAAAKTIYPYGEEISISYLIQ